MPSEFVAYWGAVTGTIGSITGILACSVQVINARRDRPIVALNPIHNFKIDQKYPSGRLAFRLEIVNQGRRVVYVEAIGIELPVDSTKIKNGSWGHRAEINIFPKREGDTMAIQEGQKETVYLDPFPEDFLKAIGPMGTCFVRDTKGQIFRKKFQMTSLPPKAQD